MLSHTNIQTATPNCVIAKAFSQPRLKQRIQQTDLGRVPKAKPLFEMTGQNPKATLRNKRWHSAKDLP